MKSKIQQRIAAIEADHNAGCTTFESIYEIIAGYAAMGFNKKQVGQIYAIPLSSFRALLARHIDPQHTIDWPKQPVYDEAVKAQAFALRRRGQSYYVIGKTLGVNDATIGYWLRQGAP